MLLFFDIDGTIFDDRRMLPSSVLPAMEEARRRGHQLLINTGRTLCNRDRRLDGFPLDGWIMGCGARIIYRGETLLASEYDLPQSLRLRSLFLSLGIPTVYECDTALYFDPRSPSHPSIAGFRQYSDAHGLSRDLAETDPEFRVVKLFCFGDSALMREAEKISASLGMPYKAIDRGHTAWEFIRAEYSKGTGVDFIRRRLGVSREDCFAFGDSRNDLDMLAHVSHSIAMGNADEDVKAACSYVTARPEEDGIALAMKHFGIIQGA